MFFKITNQDENHYGFQYQDGLNILTEEFNDNPNDSCCRGGFYFTDITNIFKYLYIGIYLREVFLPTDDKDFKMLKVNDGNKWRSNMIILGKRYDLNKETFKFLVEQGANIHSGNDYALHWSAKNGHLDIVKFLIENNADVHAIKDLALIWSAQNGHSDIVKFLIESGADINAQDNSALEWNAENGNLEMVNFLVEHGANIHADNNYALRWSTYNGHTDVADFLISKGATLKI